MMKSIEERAEEFATNRVGGKYLNPNTSQGTSWLSLNFTYKQIAKEQEAITKQEIIDKASIIFRNALIDLAREKRIDASLIDYNVNLFTEKLKE